MNEVLKRIKGGLIVSCQAEERSPLHGPHFMAAMASAAGRAGAKGIRANGPEDIKAIKKIGSLPVIGIYKLRYPGSEVYITPDLKSAEEIVSAGADIVALDGTQRERPRGMDFAQIVHVIKERFDVLIMADISTAEEALAAEASGVDLVATTLSGYTPATAYKKDGPDFALIRRLADKVKVPIIAEGRFRTPEQACHAIRLGAHAVVVGTAITNPKAITGWFVQALGKCIEG